MPILRVVHQGTNTVKNSKIQPLTTKFQNFKISYSELFTYFHNWLKDIYNSLYNLGEPISKTRIVKNIARSLPEKFVSKITTIEESKDLNTLTKNELFSYLQTFKSDVLNK